MIRVELENAFEMLLILALQLVLPAPLGEFFVRLDGVWRRAGQLLIFGFGIGRRVDACDLRPSNRQPAAARKFDYERRLIRVSGLNDLAFESAAAGEVNDVGPQCATTTSNRKRKRERAGRAPVVNAKDHRAVFIAGGRIYVLLYWPPAFGIGLFLRRF